MAKEGRATMSIIPSTYTYQWTWRCLGADATWHINKQLKQSML